jgi:amino acid permease
MNGRNRPRRSRRRRRRSIIIVIYLLDVVHALAFVVPHCQQPIMTHRRRRNHHRLMSSKNRIVDIENVSLSDKYDDDEEPCLAGDNVVTSCVITSFDGVRETDPPRIIGVAGGTQNKLSATINMCKCICGAGSFALPYVFLKEGVIGGTVSMLFCGYLAAFTMKSLNQSRMLVSMDEGIPPTSYVELTNKTLGTMASRAVFALTLAASLGVCSTYLVFIGQTLASLSGDVNSNNIVRALAPNIDSSMWQLIAATIVLPLSLIRNYGVFAFTSALGVVAVLGGMIATVAYGVFVDPGGGFVEAIAAASQSKMWPDSFQDAFGGSFGTIAYLFCINFLTFPIINSMKSPREDYDEAVNVSVTIVWIVNVVFAVLCLGFYGNETQDLILQNLGNSVYLSALKILLCVDLLFTFPVVFSSGRQILENALIPRGELKYTTVDRENSLSAVLSRVVLTTAAVTMCLGLSRLGGFGVVANLVGGVAQGTLAFVLPPMISIALSRSRRMNDASFNVDELSQWLVLCFGAVVVVSVTYSTLAELAESMQP